MFERVSFSVLMFQTYDSSCDIFCMLEYSFSEPLPSTTCSKVVAYSLVLFVCFVTWVHSCV